MAKTKSKCKDTNIIWKPTIFYEKEFIKRQIMRFSRNLIKGVHSHKSTKQQTWHYNYCQKRLSLHHRKYDRDFHERGTGYFYSGIVSSAVRHSHELCHGSRLQDISWWKLQSSLQLLWFHQERKILYLSVSRTDFRHHPGIYSIYNGNERIYVRKFAQE